MTPERYRQVGVLYHAALQVEAGYREAFLAEASGDDEELRSEVASLLEAHDKAGLYLAAPALDVAARWLSERKASSLIGTSLGRYRVLSLLGAGGMGEVYLAEDSELRRQVALKVLPVEWTGDSRRLARFRREAQILAALKHENIAAIYGLEQTSERNCLVLEFVEGETLAECVARRGALPVGEALPIARQIADALEYAHAKGITHRDIKPSNIKLTPGGAIKVLDFGLAKARPGAEAGTEPAEKAVGATMEGQILGTPAYMSPEQVRHTGVGPQTDVWAFGCVLYELLTGQRAFPRDTAPDTLAAVLEREPDWRALPDATPPNIRTLLRRCLQKDPARRLHHIADARIEIEDTAAEPAALAETAGVPRGGPGRPWKFVSATAAVAVMAVAFALWLGSKSPVPGPAETVRLTVTLPQGVSVTRGPGFASSVALSPDGRTLVIAGTGETGQRLYQRRLAGQDVVPLAGTEGGSAPFFAPDGAWLGFFAEGRLKRVPAGGGVSVDIAGVPDFPDGVSWGPNGRIVAAFGTRSAVYGVDANGGNLEPITALEEGEVGHSRPEILPDGRTLIFDSGGWVHALDLTSKRRTRLVQGVAPRYANTGHLILSRGRTLLAAPFDLSRLRVGGSLVPLIEGVEGDTATNCVGDRHYAISPNGALAYVPAPALYGLVLVKPDGTERTVTEERAWFENPRFSPNGRRLVVAAASRAGEPTDLWIHDLETRSATKLTFEGGRSPVWTPDGARVTYSGPGQRQGIYTKATDGRSEAEPLLALDGFHWLVGWTRDGRTLAFGAIEKAAPDQSSRSSIVAVSGGESSRVVGPGNVWGGRLSPDGRWLAYYTLETGSFEVYVTPFPGAGTRWLISRGGGRDPSWAPDGTEIYYRSGDRLLAAGIETSDGIRVLSRRVVAQPFSPPLYDDYDIHPDGRTLVLVRPDAPQGREVAMVLNWFEELKGSLLAGW